MNVVLPSNDDRAIKRMQEQLDEKYNIYVVYKSTSDQTSTLVDGEKEADMSVNTSRDEKVFYLRLSVQIYLEEIDFEALERLVPSLLASHTDD